MLMSRLGVAGRVLCGLFFLCLSFAGVTSMIGYIELTARTIQDFGGEWAFIIVHNTSYNPQCTLIRLPSSFS